MKDNQPNNQLTNRPVTVYQSLMAQYIEKMLRYVIYTQSADKSKYTDIQTTHR